MKITHDYVGNKAHEVSKVWRLGFHIFDCDNERVFRLCYFRNSHATYYIQLAIRMRESLAISG